MTDLVVQGLPTLDLTTDAARARVRARYRAEARFRLYGLAAIGLTAVFLVVVLADIVIKGLPAFTQYQFVLEVPLKPSEIDPQGTKDPAVIRQGDFQGLVRDAMRAIFPEVTDRAGRRLLDGLLSSGAVDRLRDRVVANPDLVGQTVKAPILIAERADLYYQNIGTPISRRAGRGIASSSGTTGEITILSSANDFSSDLVTIKQALSVRAARRPVRGRPPQSVPSARSKPARRNSSAP